MILKQFYLPCLAHASYVIGDEATGTAVVVDLQRDTEQYVAFAAENGLTIKYVKDGLHCLKSRPDLTGATEQLSAPFAAEVLSSSQPPQLIDVRTPRERDQRHIAGSLGIPLNHLAENLDKLPWDRPLFVYCAGGYRSSIAASLLQSRGFSRVSEIAGGIASWEAARLPVQTSSTSESLDAARLQP